MIDEVEEVLAAAERLSPKGLARLVRILQEVEGQGLLVEAPPVRPAVLERHDFLTVEEYFELEKNSLESYEYVAGRVFATSGATRAHNLIVGNVFAAVRAHLKKGRCTVYTSKMKTYVRANYEEFFYLPDVVVTCREKNEPNDRIEDARLVIEVLSPSTERIDRREKRLVYPHIPTLEEYVLISQGSPEITFHRRTDRWRPTAQTSMRKSADFKSIDLSLPLAQVYERVF